MTILGGSSLQNNLQRTLATIIPLLIAQPPSTFDRTTTGKHAAAGLFTV
jgi:hypothetical protein